MNDDKGNFQNNPEGRLINPAKNQIRKMSNMTLVNI